jgi:hypothetical protein
MSYARLSHFKTLSSQTIKRPSELDPIKEEVDNSLEFERGSLEALTEYHAFLCDQLQHSLETNSSLEAKLERGCTQLTLLNETFAAIQVLQKSIRKLEIKDVIVIDVEKEFGAKRLHR